VILLALPVFGRAGPAAEVEARNSVNPILLARV
jgi:hypothetical protein